MSQLTITKADKMQQKLIKYGEKLNKKAKKELPVSRPPTPKPVTGDTPEGYYQELVEHQRKVKDPNVVIIEAKEETDEEKAERELTLILKRNKIKVNNRILDDFLDWFFGELELNEDDLKLEEPPTEEEIKKKEEKMKQIKDKKIENKKKKIELILTAHQVPKNDSLINDLLI
jgi:hypothetical protein